MMNLTFHVATLFNCLNIDNLIDKYEHDPIWRQTVVGCEILHILQDMFKFNVKFVHKDTLFNENYKVVLSNASVDFYVRPMTLKEEFLVETCPIFAVFHWRLGFLMRYKEHNIEQTFYTLPFSTYVWTCILWTLLLSTLVFYLLSYWEKRLIGGESCFHHELLLAFSAYCQHILPLQANLSSRRIAYLIFILGAYIIHCFYTSNLLSHLVNDKGKGMDLKGLAQSEYELVIIKDMNLVTEKRIQQVSTDRYLRIVEEKLRKAKIMNVIPALEAVRDSKTAVLTDYTTIYPIVKKIFEDRAICELIEVNLYQNVQKYFVTSKDFPLKDNFKVGLLRAREAGLISRLVGLDKPSYTCDDIVNHEPMDLSLISTPLIILFSSYLLAVVILILEKIHFDRYHLWPYTE